MFICVVCKKQYADTYVHLQEEIEDQIHIDYAKKVQETTYTTPCFCNGTICQERVGEEGWEIYCSQCVFIWDED